MKLSAAQIAEVLKGSLLSIFNKEFLIFLFFLLLSGGFWLSMTLDDTYEKEIEVPIKLVNVPKNAIMTTEMEDTVRVTIRDKGFAFLSYKYSNRIRPINLNFSTYSGKKQGYGSVPLADVQKIVYQRLYNSSKITQIKPDKFEFYYNFGLSKTLPVKLVGTIKPADTYYLARKQITPETVTVYADKAKLDSLKFIETKLTNITNFSDTVSQQIELQKLLGVKCVPSSVKLSLYPDIMTEESAEVPIKYINVPAGKVVRTFPSHVKVKFNVGVSVFRHISFDNFSVIVNYDELDTEKPDRCKLHLITVPHGVRQARLETDEVDYLIEQQ